MTRGETRGATLTAALLIGLALGSSAQAVPAQAGAPAQAAEPSDTCAFGYGAPTPCRVSATAAADGVTTVTYRAQGRTAVFRGRSQSGWWSGELNGAPAMGYELNRGHTVYSRRDLKTVFEHWSAGMRHGTY